MLIVKRGIFKLCVSRISAVFVLYLFMIMTTFAGVDTLDLQFSDWTLQGTGGNTLTDAGDGVLSVSASSSGGGCYWLSPVLALQPRAVYALDFEGSFLPGGDADPWYVAGSPQVGMVSYNIGLGWWAVRHWTNYNFIVTVPDEIIPERTKLRFGEVGMRTGKVLYRNISLKEVIPSYKHIGSIELGNGEVLYDNKYQFITRYLVYGNQSRPLKSFLCAFNSNRWVFFKDDYVIYEHVIAGVKQLSGHIELHIDWYGEGKLFAEVKSSKVDGEWKKIGEVSKPGESSFSLPAELFPAENVEVRLRGEFTRAFRGNFAPGSIQVGAYRYYAVTDRTVHGILKGKTIYSERGDK